MDKKEESQDEAIESSGNLDENRWIPIEERLPTKKECSLYPLYHCLNSIFECSLEFEFYEPQTRRVFFDFSKQSWGGMNGNCDDLVVAWRPLAKPYRTENKNTVNTKRKEDE